MFRDASGWRFFAGRGHRGKLVTTTSAAHWLFGIVKRKEQGFALLIVLVVLVALSLMIGAVISATRGYTNETMSRLASLRLNAALDGAIATIGRDLSHPVMQGMPLVTSTVMDIGPVAVKVTVRPEIAKVDINMADPKL